MSISKKFEYLVMLLFAILVMGSINIGKSFGDESGLTVLKTGDSIFVRSYFSSEYDVVISLKKGNNGQIDFSKAGLVAKTAPMDAATCNKAILIHGCTDDATPWNVNGTYIGANHGWNGVIQIESPEHGMTDTDMGSEWTDSKGAKFFLISIVNPSRLWMMPENRGNLQSWKFNPNIAGTQLTCAVKNRTLNIEKVNRVQLTPACRIREQLYLVDGKAPLVDNQAVTCQSFDIAEEYDIINPASFIDMVKQQPGQKINPIDERLDTILSNKILYQFQPYGACTVSHTSTIKNNIDLTYMGFIQTRILVKMPADVRSYYIPNTLPFSSGSQQYDFRAVQDFPELPKTAIEFNVVNKNIESSEKLPYRFIQFLKRDNPKATFTVGYAIGYSLLSGITQPQSRAEKCETALTIWKSGKSYPHAIDKKQRKIAAGTTIECTAYRQYFDPHAASANATAVYWHKEGDTWVLYADYHKNVENDTIKLPAFMAGKKLSIIDSTPSVTLISGDNVTESGIVLSVKDGYGYIVLRLDEAQNPSSEEKKSR